MEFLIGLCIFPLGYGVWRVLYWLKGKNLRFLEIRHYGPSNFMEPIKGSFSHRVPGSFPLPKNFDRGWDPVLDELLFLHAEKAVKNQRRMWIRYKGLQRQETERKIEVYRTDVEGSIFAWCCLREEPRVFHRHRILAWYQLEERFIPDPGLFHWAEEEFPQGKDAIPYNRWKQLRQIRVEEKGQV